MHLRFTVSAVFWKYKAETTDIKVKSDWQGFVSHDIAIESHRPAN